MRPESEDGYTGEAYKCHGCAAVARVTDRFADSKTDARGLFISVRPRAKPRG